jgi:argininosuccinate lyase
MKIWQKETSPDRQLEQFTVGKDRDFDLQLAAFDVIGSMAHAKMLAHCGLLEASEEQALQHELKNIYASILAGTFCIDASQEDIHSQVEAILSSRLGDSGKRIHTARSRNDQSLLDIKLFIRHELKGIVKETEQLFLLLNSLSEKHRNDLLPGYSHYQLAMPSSFGLWLGAYAESLSDDLGLVLAAYRVADKNPLGSAAGYGSSFPINRELTTALLGFSGMNVNSVYAQMTRGKTEKAAATALAGIASTIGKLASDCTLFMNQQFAFISFPDTLTTGSSIMPHKKNPDAWELIRAKCNRLQSIPNELSLLLGNLPSGYHRDLQLTKEILFPAFGELHSCLSMTRLMLENMIVRKNILESKEFDLLFTVDAVNALVQEGLPFRDAYRKIGLEVESGTYQRPASIEHSHTGSIGQPGNERIKQEFCKRLDEFQFEKAESALALLTGTVPAVADAD